ncbi:hypothetical protein, partial [Intrasporangium sp.]|uniref:hypothetical protein n=1 Tax=Intrasporangium sp. TaxID=1925024 RepID=UPI003221ACE6
TGHQPKFQETRDNLLGAVGKRPGHAYDRPQRPSTDAQLTTGASAAAHGRATNESTFENEGVLL